MRVPVWLTLGVAALVCVFGAYRIRLAFRSDEEDERARSRKGLYAMGRRTHLLVGIVYLLLGGALIATSFGWSPVGSLFTGRAPDAATTRFVPVEEAFPNRATGGEATPKQPAPEEAAPRAGAAPTAESAPARGSAQQPK